ncbi:hypothetical protein C0J52_12121 [Blattella germanica]|nr:hypothetical protein C0J52_12121 [Blattella germanica]
MDIRKAFTSSFYDLDMRLTTVAFLKQNISPFYRLSTFFDDDFYQSCKITPQQLPEKPHKNRNPKQWTEARLFLSRLSKLEVQYHNLPKKEVVRFMYECLGKVKVNKENAKIVVDAVLEADKKREFGLGLFRLELYVADILDGTCSPTSKPKILNSTECSAWVDGQNALGPIVGKYCMNLAIKKAMKHGIGIVVANHSNYIGRCGYYTKMAMEKNMIGITFTNTAHVLCPTRAKKTFFGWNPVAIAAPSLTKKNNLMVEVMSTAITMRQMISCMSMGLEIPFNTAMNAAGHVTTDPKEALADGCILPLGGIEETGGYKGYGMAIFCEILCGILADSSFGRAIKRADEMSIEPSNFGHCFIVVNPNFFSLKFKKSMSIFAATLRRLQPIDESEPVVFPGDYEKFMQSYVSSGQGLRYRLVEIMAAYQLSCLLSVPPIKLK